MLVRIVMLEELADTGICLLVLVNNSLTLAYVHWF